MEPQGKAAFIKLWWRVLCFQFYFILIIFAQEGAKPLKFPSFPLLRIAQVMIPQPVDQLSTLAAEHF